MKSKKQARRGRSLSASVWKWQSFFMGQKKELGAFGEIFPFQT